MKYFVLVLSSVFIFSSCNKCLECTNQNYSQTVCNDMPIYKELKKGNATLTDENGNELKCK